MSDKDYKAAWDEAYRNNNALTNWEMVPLHDLAMALSQSGIDLHNLFSILDLGCGRGIRSAIAFLLNDDLNRKDLSYIGIDCSHRAVSSARNLYKDLSIEPTAETPFIKAIEEALPQGCIRQQLKMTVDLYDADVFEWMGKYAGPKFDLVIDWMLLHEILPDDRMRYARLISKSCEKYIILKTCSVEGSTITKLPDALPGIPKHAIDQAEIERMFTGEFDIVYIEEYAEDLHPQVPITDEVITAKRAYVLERRQ